ncbi:hypothetical protein Q7P35_005508 [Cladosporium inversicolor]
MAGLYAHPYYEPPFEHVDHPHERLHQHNTFLGVMARRKPDQKTYPNHPDVDISDAISYYLIELEVPGIKDAGAIALNWTSWRSLVVAGTIFRSWDPKTTLDLDSASNSKSEKGDAAGELRLDVEAPKDAKDEADAENAQLPPYLVIGERRIGSFRREFHFPVDVEVEKVEAKLEAGLLRIKVPKKSHTYPKGAGRIRIQSED